MRSLHFACGAVFGATAGLAFGLKMHRKRNRVVRCVRNVAESVSRSFR